MIVIFSVVAFLPYRVIYTNEMQINNIKTSIHCSVWHQVDFIKANLWISNICIWSIGCFTIIIYSCILTAPTKDVSRYQSINIIIPNKCTVNSRRTFFITALWQIR